MLFAKLFTVIVVIFQVYFVGSVAKVDERVTVRPALYNDATRLWVEWKQRSVQMTRGLHHSTEPPSHPASVTKIVRWTHYY